MAISEVRTLLDAHEVEAVHMGAVAQFLPTTANPITVEFVRVQFDRLRLGRSSESAARIRHVQQTEARSFIKFLTSPDAGLVSNGFALGHENVMRHAEAEIFYER